MTQDFKEKIFLSFHNAYDIPIGVFDSRAELSKLYSPFGQRQSARYLLDCTRALNVKSNASACFVLDETNLGWLRITLADSFILLGPILAGAHPDFAYAGIPEYSFGMFARIGKNLIFLLDIEECEIEYQIADSAARSEVEYRDLRAEEFADVDVFTSTSAAMQTIRSGDINAVAEFLASKAFTSMAEKLCRDVESSRTALIYGMAIYYSQALLAGVSYLDAIGILGKYAEEQKKHTSGMALMAAHARMIYDYTNAVHRTKRDSDLPELLKKAIRYIDENIYTAISLNALAEHCAYSLTAIQHLFRAELNISPKEYIRNKKIEKACFFISYTAFPFTEIALRLGYCSQSYFNKQFKSVMKMTPGEYRSLKAALP